MFRSRNKLSSSGRYKSSSLLTLNEIDEIEKKFDWRKNYFVSPKEIGRGHFSKVYQITCENSKKLLAAKIIRRRKGGIDRLEKIRKEAEIIKRLNEKNIISVIQIIETHESFSEVVLISEFAKGGSLFNLVQDFNKGLNQNYVKCVIFKLLEALKSMHLDNIVHLDIKADNILLRELYPSTNIAICDFGLATELKKGSNYKELVGTPDYMAPEIINYEKITVNADMWSVGVLIYFLLSGISPFMGSSKDETLMNVSKIRLLFDSVFIESEYSDAKNLISSLCVKSPTLRLSSSDAHSHIWFQNIHLLNLDYPIIDTNNESFPIKPILNQSIPKPKLNNNFDIDSQSNDNLNNYNYDGTTNILRCQSVDLDSVDLDSKFKSVYIQPPHSLFQTASCDDIFFNDNDNDKDTMDGSETAGELDNNNHTPLNKRKSVHQLSHVEEVADEMSYDCNGVIDISKDFNNSDKTKNGDSNIEILNNIIEEKQQHSLENPVTIESAELPEQPNEISEIIIQSDVLEKEPDSEQQEYRESENVNPINDKFTISSDTQQTVIEIEPENFRKSPEIPNKNLSVDPLDEYENISNSGEEKSKHHRGTRRYYSTTDIDEEDDYRYTSLLTHFRLSELCKLL